MNNSKIILEVNDLGQLWRIFKLDAFYLLYLNSIWCFNADGSSYWGMFVFQCRRVMSIKTRNTQISCFKAFGSWNLYSEISCFNAFGSWDLSVFFFEGPTATFSKFMKWKDRKTSYYLWITELLKLCPNNEMSIYHALL